jgi:DNA-binding transcriptional ArsR family regulator
LPSLPSLDGKGEGLSERAGRSGDEPPERLRALAEAMAHPVRARLLFAVAEKTDDGVSIRQLSERTGNPQRRVRYHLDALLELGLVGIADRRQHRGTVERFYRVEQIPYLTSQQLDEFDEDQAQQLAFQILKAVLDDARRAMGADVFGIRSGHVLIRVPCEVDEKGWREIGDIEERTLAAVQTAVSRARDRLKASGESPIAAVAALLLFEVPHWPTF